MKEDWVYSNHYNVRGIDCNVDLNLSAIAVLKIMHGVATEQIVIHEVSANELAKDKMAWIVINQDVEFIKAAKLGQKVKAVTYPSGIEKIFTYRDYLIFDENDELIAKSSGKFIMMDLEKRKMIAIPDKIKARIAHTHSIHKVSRPEKINIKGTEVFTDMNFEVRYFDLDLNGHLNNNNYFKWMLDPLDKTYFESKRLKSIHVNFKSEIGFGAKINSKVFRINDHELEHVLERNGNIVSSGRTVWQTIQ